MITFFVFFWLICVKSLIRGLIFCTICVIINSSSNTAYGGIFMFKRMALIFAILSLITVFASCNFGGGGGAGNSPTEDLIYDKDTKLNIVRGNDEIPDDLLTAFYDEFFAIMTEFPIIVDGSAAKIDHEIVIGRSERAVSLDGYKRLEAMEADSKDHFRYLIYSDGSSVAICYDLDSEDAAITTVLEYFMKNCIKLPFTAKPGVITRGQVSLTEFIDAADERYLESKWAALEQAVGKDITSSIKSLYSIFSDDVIDWFANLYDPGIGGYYYSNSGRDSQGFLPDIESTSQSIGYVNASGMLQQTGESSSDFFSEEMQAQIIRFVKSLQDEDGYFYHPQWVKAHHAASRLSRDLNWAVGMLSQFGSAPTYDTPRGDKGDGILADGSTVPTSSVGLTSPYGSSVAAAVSRVIAAAAMEERFESRDSFLEYLEGRFGENGNQPIVTNSYVAGNELSSLSNTIKQRDKELAELGEPTIAPALIQWLNDRQNSLGHWHHELDEDGKYIPVTNYYANNGLLKIANLYNDLGYKMNMIEIATETAVSSITSDEEVEAIVDIYNTWFCVNCLRRNLVNFGGVEGREEYARLKARLFELAPEAITVTRNKLSKFLKLDGSFSYLQNASAHLSQNMAVAIPGTNEGDVNATRIALQTITDMYGSLGISDYFVPLYTHGDAVRYKDLLENLTPFEKPTIDFIEPDVIHSSNRGTGIHKDKAEGYADTTVGALNESGFIGTNYPEYLIFDDLGADISANVVKIESDAALEFKNYHYQRDPMLMFNVTDRTVWDNNDSYVVEFDMLYEYGSRGEGGDVMQFFFLNNKNSAASIWYDGSLTITQSLEQDAYYINGCGVENYALELCRWYNIRIEISDVRTGSAEILLYIDGTLAGQKYATSSARQLEAFTVRHRFDVKDGRIFFDNLYVNSVNETDEEYVDPNTYVDLPEYERGNGSAGAVEGFTDKNAADAKSEGIFGTVNTGTPESGYYGIYFDDDDPKGIQYVKGTEVDGDGAIEFGSLGNGDPYLTFINGSTADSAVLEFDFMIDSLSVVNGSGNYFVFYPSRSADAYSEVNSGAITVNKNAYDEFYIQLGGCTNVAKLKAGTWYNIRIEMRDLASNPVFTLKVNGVTVAETTLSGSVSLKAVFTRFAWGEKSGRVYFDNYYFGAPEN